MMAAIVKVLGIGRRTGATIEAGIFCESGVLRVGDHLTILRRPNGDEVSTDLEVLEIRFYDQLVDELEEVFSGNVLFVEHEQTSLEERSTLESP
jgi:hypothetical protein